MTNIINDDLKTQKSNVYNPVLILNIDYTPLGICIAKRAIVLLFSKKAETVIISDKLINTVNSSYKIPSVIKTLKYIKRPYEKKISRFGIFARDNFSCQYCGNEQKSLTIDHVIPKSKNGSHSWDNLVTACMDCNHKKAGRTPKEANMNLRIKPHIPNLNTHILKYSNKFQNSWNQFLSK
ncbi:MAG: HNH endonuclease [Candidatus Marinimicrobia bacterium]|nr:HNH endonuclease [Candidatus Neomarinimicrobiota bacterium]|tara:strand:+ start:13905 stop:14444 length:540 start_codon:yes stop_codon:yes gene_type:complete